MSEKQEVSKWKMRRGEKKIIVKKKRDKYIVRKR
jgi:hypothetical protein